MPGTIAETNCHWEAVSDSAFCEIGVAVPAAISVAAVAAVVGAFVVLTGTFW